MSAGIDGRQATQVEENARSAFRTSESEQSEKAKQMVSFPTEFTIKTSGGEDVRAT